MLLRSLPEWHQAKRLWGRERRRIAVFAGYNVDILIKTGYSYYPDQVLFRLLPGVFWQVFKNARVKKRTFHFPRLVMSAVRVWKTIPEVSLYRSPLQFHVKQVKSWVLERERSNLGKNTLLIPAWRQLIYFMVLQEKKLAFCFVREDCSCIDLNAVFQTSFKSGWKDEFVWNLYTALKKKKKNTSVMSGKRRTTTVTQPL